MPKNEGTRSVHCSFCGKSQEEVYRLLAGPGVFICNECVMQCESILRDGDELPQKSAKDDAPPRLPTPKEI